MKSRGLKYSRFTQTQSTADLETADCILSRTGFVICHANCQVMWCSKLQSEITLSTAEAKNIALSHALRETIPVQNLTKEIHCIFDFPNPMTDFNITLHEDNLSAIAMAESLKFTPRMKHIAIKYHHFRSRVNTSFNKPVISSSSTYQPRNSLLTYSLSQSILTAFSLYARC